MSETGGNDKSEDDKVNRRRYRDERERREAKDGITRRDFLDGAAVTAGGLAAAAAFPHLTGSEAMAHGGGFKGDPPLPPSYYPPSFENPYTGIPNKVVRRTIKIDGPPPNDPSKIHSTRGGPGIHAKVIDTKEKYDCVIVGAGASGIAAAKYYQDRFGPNKRILIVDALPDFGGHSHRNEFHIPNAANNNADVLTLRNGGTVNLDSIGTWDDPGPNGIPASDGLPALDFLAWAGVDTDTETLWENGDAAGIPASFGLYQRLLFPAADFGGTDHVIPARNAGPFAGLEPVDRRRLDRVPQPHPVLAGRPRWDPARPDRRRGLPGERAGRAADRGAKARVPDLDHLQALPRQPRRDQRRGVPR